MLSAADTHSHPTLEAAAKVPNQLDGEQRMELCQPKDISESAAQADKTQHLMKADLQRGGEKPLMSPIYVNTPLLLQNQS